MPIKFQPSILINKKVLISEGSFRSPPPFPPTEAISGSIVQLIYMYAYHFPPYVRTKFQLSILINKKLLPSAPRKGRYAVLRARGGSSHTNAHYSILFCMNSMHTKFQLSILINKKLLKKGGLRPPTKSRFAVHGRGKLHVYIYFCSIYAYQISEFHLNKQKRRTFCPMSGPFSGPGRIAHTYAYHCISISLVNTNFVAEHLRPVSR